ncbi:MAG: tryptophan synthase subunit alpha [Coriobacteriia bacterium]
MSDRTYSPRLGRAFAHGRPALVVYLMAGYPDRARSLAALHAVADAGADLIEIGVPYSDALADGPVIVRAANAARQAAAGGFGLPHAIDLAEEFLAHAGDGAPPVALMTYANPLHHMGYSAAADRMLRAGIGGVIVPDMPTSVAAPWLQAVSGSGSGGVGLDTVFLAAPTSTPERLDEIGRMSLGFVYCVSTTGVTGERDELPPGIAETVQRVRQHTELPVAVGFGISTPEQAAGVARIADGVIVGSAAVKRQGDIDALGTFVRELACAVRS